MAKSGTSKKLRGEVSPFDEQSVRTARQHAKNVTDALAHVAAASFIMTPAAPSGPSDVPGDTPTGITVDYEDLEDGDMPVGALQDFQLVALIKNILARGRAPFLFRFQSQIYLRAAGTS